MRSPWRAIDHRSKTRRFLAAGAVLAGLFGCSRESSPDPAPAPAPPPADSTPVAPGDPRGDWTVVGHRFSGVSAAVEVDVSGWRGRRLHYASDAAVWQSDSCRAPGFRSYTAATDSFLGIGFHANAVDLGIDVKAMPRLRLTEITCGGEDWIAPGGLLIWTGADRALTPWEGAFFELERRPPAGTVP
jgi:hypothetical protein